MQREPALSGRKSASTSSASCLSQPSALFIFRTPFRPLVNALRSDPHVQCVRMRLSWRMQLIVFVVVAAVVISRRPDALLNPQFYAEDGAVWYAQAYNFGWLHSLTLPQAGYLQTLPRLVAGLSLLVPFGSAPLLMNWAAIGFQVLPVTVLLSSRCSGWAPLWVRGLQALLYLAMPTSREIDAVLSNAQWHLALVACMVAFAHAPTNASWKAFD